MSCQSDIPPTNKIKGSRLIANALAENGVEYIFEIPGAGVAIILDEVATKDAMHHITFRHEQGAALAAEAYARITGKPGVCMATSGPGATNLITGIANAYCDSVPMVAITGQGPQFKLKGDYPTRQKSFQEVDIVSVCRPITKAAMQIKNVNDIGRTINMAFKIAMEGRKGPVLIDIPSDIITSEIEPRKYQEIPVWIDEIKPATDFNKGKVENILNNSKQPVLYVGGGAQRASSEVIKFIDKTKIPVVHTLMGKGIVPDDHPLCFGLQGLAGSRIANWMLNNADVVLALGARFADKAVGNDYSFTGKLIHVDIDPWEFDKMVVVDERILAKVEDIMPVLDNELNIRPETGEWLSVINEKAAEYTWDREYEDFPLLAKFFEYLSRHSKGAIITTDVGQHQMWANQLYRVTETVDT